MQAKTTFWLTSSGVTLVRLLQRFMHRIHTPFEATPRGCACPVARCLSREKSHSVRPAAGLDWERPELASLTSRGDRPLFAQLGWRAARHLPPADLRSPAAAVFQSKAPAAPALGSSGGSALHLRAQRGLSTVPSQQLRPTTPSPLGPHCPDSWSSCPSPGCSLCCLPRAGGWR